MEVVTLPKLGISDEGELVAWEVDVGEPIEEDDLLVTFESEKASAEVRAPAGGVLLERYFEAGAVVEIEPGLPIAVIGEPHEQPPSFEELTAEGDAASAGGDTPEPSSGPASGSSDGDAGSDEAEAEVKATPRAKRYAREHGVDLAAVEGTGPQGAVTEGDVESYASAAGAEREASDDEAADDGPTVVERRELTGTRKTVAERLSESAREKPHVMGTREISIEGAEALVERVNQQDGADVSLNDIVLLAVARTLEDLPEFNAWYRDGTLELVEEVNVGYAVDSEKGLVVPVLGDLHEKDLRTVSEERRRLVGRVLDDEHTTADLQGGTFTVTNVGALGMDISYSIIDPPQVAILAIGRRKPVPFERDGTVEFERSVTFSLTIDHRVLDGGDSGAFLERLNDYLQHPGSLLDGFDY